MFDLDFQTVQAMTKHARLPWEFGANTFSGSRDISYTNKKVTDRAQNRILR